MSASAPPVGCCSSAAGRSRAGVPPCRFRPLRGYPGVRFPGPGRVPVCPLLACVRVALRFGGRYCRTPFRMALPDVVPGDSFLRTTAPPCARPTPFLAFVGLVLRPCCRRRTLRARLRSSVVLPDGSGGGCWRAAPRAVVVSPLNGGRRPASSGEEPSPGVAPVRPRALANLTDVLPSPYRLSHSMGCATASASFLMPVEVLVHNRPDRQVRQDGPEALDARLPPTCCAIPPHARVGRPAPG